MPIARTASHSVGLDLALDFPVPAVSPLRRSPSTPAALAAAGAGSPAAAKVTPAVAPATAPAPPAPSMRRSASSTASLAVAALRRSGSSTTSLSALAPCGPIPRSASSTVALATLGRGAGLGPRVISHTSLLSSQRPSSEHLAGLLFSSQQASLLTLQGSEAEPASRSRSATMCVDTPRNMSYDNLVALRAVYEQPRRAEDEGGNSPHVVVPAGSPDAALLLAPHPALPPATLESDDETNHDDSDFVLKPAPAPVLTASAAPLALAVPAPAEFPQRLRDRHLDLAPLSVKRASAPAAWSLPACTPASVLDLPVHGVRYDRCCICLDFGQCSASSCCNMPRHIKCEKRNLVRRLDLISLRSDGLVSLPCSVCRQEWKAVAQHDPFVLAVLDKLAVISKGSAAQASIHDAELDLPGAVPIALAGQSHQRLTAPVTLRDIVRFSVRSQRRRMRLAATLVLTPGLALAITTIAPTSNLIVAGNVAAISGAVLGGAAFGAAIFLALAALELRGNRQAEFESALENPEANNEVGALTMASGGRLPPFVEAMMVYQKAQRGGITHLASLLRKRPA